MKLQFPIGIDSDRFVRALELPQVQDHINELKERFAGRKVGSVCSSESTILAIIIELANCASKICGYTYRDFVNFQQNIYRSAF